MEDATNLHLILSLSKDDPEGAELEHVSTSST